MDTLAKIVTILDQKCISQKELTDFLGLQKGAFTKWKNGENTSYIKHIGKIAKFLDTDPNYLLGTEKKPPQSEGLTELQQKALDATMQLEGKDLEAAIQYLRYLIDSRDKK